MEDYKLERIQMIANKNLTYNKDINQHIESCKISIDIINQKDNTIDILRNMLTIKDKEIGELEEKYLINRKEEFIRILRKDIEIKELREVLEEQYKLINDLIEKINKN